MCECLLPGIKCMRVVVVTADFGSWARRDHSCTRQHRWCLTRAHTYVQAHTVAHTRVRSGPLSCNLRGCSLFSLIRDISTALQLYLHLFLYLRKLFIENVCFSNNTTYKNKYSGKNTVQVYNVHNMECQSVPIRL